MGTPLPPSNCWKSQTVISAISRALPKDNLPCWNKWMASSRVNSWGVMRVAWIISRGISIEIVAVIFYLHFILIGHFTSYRCPCPTPPEELCLQSKNSCPRGGTKKFGPYFFCFLLILHGTHKRRKRYKLTE